jgi:FXSXX-COOH protein
VDNSSPAISHRDAPSAGIADLRDVPLAELQHDADALRLASRVTEAADGQSRIRIAGFQSVIN